MKIVNTVNTVKIYVNTVKLIYPRLPTVIIRFSQLVNQLCQLWLISHADDEESVGEVGETDLPGNAMVNVFFQTTLL